MNLSTSSKHALPVMEYFYSIQGEGYYQGRAAFFIRLGGCDVGCVWCDVKESWDAELHPKMTLDDLVNEVKKTNASFVVVTGGEPLMHDCTILTEILHLEGLELAIETSGAHPMSGYWDWICLSPKKFKKPLEEVLLAADELKVVVYNKSDFDWAEAYASLVSEDCKLFLQPEWSKEKEMAPLIIDYVQEHPEWSLSLQIHKYLNLR